MKKIVIGERLKDKKYDYRETCFGICVKDGKALLVKKDGQYSFIGGGIEHGETHFECLKREFVEESGYEILSIHPFVSIDCYWLAAGKWPLESFANFYLVEVGKKLGEPTELGHIVKSIDIMEVGKNLPLPYHKKAWEIYIKECELL